MDDFQDPEISRTVVDCLPTGVCVIDRNGKILIWNQGAERIVGHRQHEVIGRHHEYLLARLDNDSPPQCSEDCPFARTLHEGRSIESGIVLQHRQGHSVPVLMRFVAIRDTHGSIVAVAASFDTHNSSSRRETDRRSAPVGCADVITGLANPGFTQFQLRENLAGFGEYQIPFGIICVRAEQLEHFRAAYGHEAGDYILQVIAQNLSNSFRPSDFVGRWGEDEFIAVLTNCGRSGVEKVFYRVRPLVYSASIRWWGEVLSLKATLGYATVQAEDSVATLVERAERSLEQHAGDAIVPPLKARGAGTES